jgi:hypothetical protein
MKFISNNPPSLSNRRLFFLTFLFGMICNCFLSGVENQKFYDSVNARKIFFNGNYDWDNYVNKKKYFDDNRISLMTIYEIPQMISRESFEKYILSTLTNPNDKKTVESNYDKLISIKNPKKDDKDYYYLKNPYISNDDIKRIKSILKTIKFPEWDYFIVFYEDKTELKKSTGILDKEYLGETFSYGTISYQFNYERMLVGVQVFFQNNNNSYLQFDIANPNKFDVYLFGKPVKKNIPYYFPFDSLKFMSTTSILALLDREDIKNETMIADDDFVIKQKLIDKIIAPALPLEYNEDGAINEFGNFVFISNEELQTVKPGVNCSGFVKEIADNYIRLENPDFKRLSVGELKTKRKSERKDSPFSYVEDRYDQFFGLDWAKNIADKINEYYGYKIIKAEVLDNDEIARYYDPTGYKTEELKEILFRDQNKDSRYFYIVAFNKLRQTPPPIPVFYHLAVVVPYFKNDHFYLRCFESTDETDFSKMISLHPDEKAVIIKVPVPLTL